MRNWILIALAAACPAAPSVDLANLPVSFEDHGGRFLARAGRYTAWLSPSEMRVGGVRVRFLGASPGAKLVGAEPLPGASNYFLGNDPRQWSTGIPHYARAEARDVYPGIGLIFHGAGRSLEFDFVLQPGADPGRIRLAFDQARLDRQGHLHLPGGVVIRRPRIYQGRVEIAGRFRLHPNREASFEIAAYNPALPLVIDPMVELTSLLGTADDDRPTAVAFDAAGNIFITGTTNSRFFPLTGAVQGTNAGGYDVFLMKLNPTANVVLFSTLLGGSGDDQPLALTIDAAGNPYIGGVTRSPNFPVTSGSLQVIATGARDGFISKLNSAGSLLLASTYLGASDEDQVSALALDPAGNVYVTGVTRSLNFPTSPNAVRRALAALSDAFVAKLDGGLSRLLYSTYLGGNQDDLGNAIAVTPTGVAFVSGSTRSNNFPTTLNAQQRNLQAGTDAFLTRVSADGDRFEYSSYLGGRGDDAGRAILTDSAGLVYVAGSTGSPDFPNSAAPTPSIYTGGLFDGFLTTFQFPANPNPSAILVDGTLVRTVFCCGAGGRQLWTGTSLVAAPDGSAAAIHTAGFSDVALPAFPTADLAFPDCPRNGLLRGVFSATGQLQAYGCSGGAGSGAGVAARPGAVALVGTTDGTRDPLNLNSDILTVLVRDTDRVVQRPAAANQDNEGQVSDPAKTVQGPVPTLATGTGEAALAEVDLDLGGQPRLAFRRYYSSVLAENGFTSALGPNWMHTFDARLSLAGTTATVLLFRGKSVTFQRSGGVFLPASTEQVPHQLVDIGSAYQFLDRAANLIYTFNRSGALTRLEDRNGNALTVTVSATGPASVTDGLGRSLTFVYQSGKLARVEDQTGRSVTFSYSGDTLASVTGPAGKPARYEYVPGRTALLAQATRPAGNRRLSWTYDARGRVLSQADSLGNTTALGYLANGDTRITDPLANVTRHTHQAQENLTAVVDAAGNTSSFTYDAAGRRTGFTDRTGAAFSAVFDGAGNLTSFTDTEGNVTRYTYANQQQGRFTFYNLSRVDYAGGASVGMTHDGAGNVIAYTDPAGRRWTYSYDNRGRVNTATHPLGGVTAYAYNPDGTLASVRLPSGETQTFAYDERKQPVRITYPDGSAGSASYDANGRITQWTDPRGKVRRFTYDDTGNPHFLTDPADRTTSLAYDSEDRLSVLTDRAGNATMFRYNESGRLASIRNPGGESVSIGYDKLQRPNALTDPAGKATRFTYNPEGILAGLTDPLNRAWSLAADRMGRTTRVTTPLGRNYDFRYDRLGRLTLSPAAAYSYDSRGLLSSVTAAGAVTSFTRNALGLVTESRDPNGNVWSFGYDPGGRPTSRTDPLGRSIQYTYNAGGRIESAVSAEGTVYLRYDANGNLDGRSDSDGVDIPFRYDDENRVIGGAGLVLGRDVNGRITASNGLSLTRDAVGRVTSLTYAPGKSVRYSYDSRGLLARVTDWIGGATDFAYDDARQLVTVSRPNGVITRRAYDADGRVISIEEARGDVLAGIQLTRDAGGRVISAQRNLPVEPDLTALAAREFTYDAAGQIAAYTYDSLSRRKADDARTYTWDLAGRLAAYASGDTVISNNYDSFGLRIGRGDQTYVLNYAFATPVLAVVRNAGQDLRYYVQTPDGRLLYSINAVDDSRRYYHFDENGSTTLLTDDSGAITDAYAITPNGDLATHLGSTDNPFTFQGESGVMQEDAGLYYGREGYFDANSLSRPSLSPPLPATPQVIEPPAAPGLLPATETALQRGPSLPSPALPVLSAVLPGLPLPSIPDVQPLCNLVGQVSGLPGLADGTNPLLQALYCMRSNPQPWP